MYGSAVVRRSGRTERIRPRSDASYFCPLDSDFGERGSFNEFRRIPLEPELLEMLKGHRVP